MVSERAVVIGAGLMGHSIAQVFAQGGIETALVATREQSLERAMSLIQSNLNTLAKFGKVRTEEISDICARVHPTTDLRSAVKDAAFVLETVPEVVEVKEQVFARLDELAPENAILASNTSGLNIFEIAKVRNPANLVICHWWLPAHIMPLVDVIPGPSTSAETLGLTAELMKRLGKKPVVMKSFVNPAIINQIQNNIGVAVSNILSKEWTSPEDLDLAVKLTLGVRLPILGVVQTLDFTGLDTVFQVMQGYGLSNRIIEENVKAGHLGTKTSKGLYDYGGRSQEEILKKRDELFLRLIEVLEQLTGFRPV